MIYYLVIFSKHSNHSNIIRGIFKDKSITMEANFALKNDVFVWY